MIPVNAESINDPENDLFGMQAWEEDGEINVNCDWTPSGFSFIDIKTIEWLDAGLNYTVRIEFYGPPNQTTIENMDAQVEVMFLVNGSDFPDDIDTNSPDAHIKCLSSGYVMGDLTIEYDVMNFSGNSIIWNFNKSVVDITPQTIDIWDVVAHAGYSYTEDASGIEYSYMVIDHYGLEGIVEAYQALCTLLDIPGYSILAVGIFAIGAIVLIIRKKKYL